MKPLQPMKPLPSQPPVINPLILPENAQLALTFHVNSEHDQC